MQQHLATLVGRKVLLFDSLGTLEAKSERLGDVEIPHAVTEVVSKMPAGGTDGSKGILGDDDHRGRARVGRPGLNKTGGFRGLAARLRPPSRVFGRTPARCGA